MRLTVRLSMAVVALAAAMLSYQSLAHLGVLCGYGNLSWLYPVVVDAGAAASCAAWLHTRGRQPLVMTWALLAVSVVLNGTTHYLTSTHTAPSWLLVVAVAAVPPTVLGLCVHLAVDMRRPGQLVDGRPELAGSTAPDGPQGETSSTQSGEDQTYWDRPDPRQTPRASSVAGSTTSEVPGGGTHDSDPAAELLARGAGRRKLAAELNISEYEARKLITASRNGDGR